MTFLITIPLVEEERPEWFRKKLQVVIIESFSGYVGFDRQPWTWYWNTNYEHKVRIREGKIHIEFESEEAYTWFILKEG